MKPKVAEALKQYTENYISLHMPGHKQGQLDLLKAYSITSLDVTETSLTDDLFHPEGFLKESLEEARYYFGTKKTYYMTNGSTGGILMSISACTKRGDQILIQRNAHHSVYNAIILQELMPYYIQPAYNKEDQIFGGIDIVELEEKLKNNPSIKTVVITSPNYEGFILDIKAIAKVVHDHEGILIVDEAHGAHLPFYNFGPPSALTLGADVVIQSLHKTLPALTQTALVHINSHRISLERMDFFYQVFQTSSPSFVLTASIDACLSYMKNKDTESYQKQLDLFYQKCRELSSIRLLTFHDMYDKHIGFKDLTRIVIAGKEGILNGPLLEKEMIEGGMVPELVSERYVVCISTVADEPDVFEGLYQVLSNTKAINPYDSDEIFDIINIEEMACKPAEILNKKTQLIPLKSSASYICADFVKLYPPSIPLLVPGERISEASIALISHYLSKSLTVHGILEGQIRVVESLEA